MINRNFILNNGWHVHLWVYVDEYRIAEISHLLRDLEAPSDIIGRAVGNMRQNALNTGFTYSNLRKRRSVMVIGRAECGAEFLNSYCHELRHLVDDIARADGMELSGEPVAYLSGDICNAVADIVCKMACDCCRRR